MSVHLSKRLSVSHRLSMNSQQPGSIASRVSDATNAVGALRLFDEEGKDVTPLPLISEERKGKSTEKENQVLDPSVLSSAATQHHATTFSRSILSLSNPFVDSTSDTSDENDANKRESIFRELKQTKPKVIEKLSEAELKKMTAVMILETEAFWLFEQKPCFMSNESDHVPDQLKSNAAYTALCASRVGSDRYTERAMGTYPRPTIVKNLETDVIRYSDKSVMATVCDMWDVARQQEKKDREMEKEITAVPMPPAAGKQLSITSKIIQVSDLPNAVSRAAIDNDVHLQLASGEGEKLTTLQSEEISDIISSNSDEIGSPHSEQKTFQLSDERQSAEPQLPVNDPKFLRMLENMERALNLNSYHDKLIQYRSTKLAKLVAPPTVEASDTEISSQYIAAHATDENLPKSIYNTSIVDENARDLRINSVGPASTSVGQQNSQKNQPDEMVTSSAGHPTVDDDKDKGYCVPPDLWLLWKFSCHDTKGRNVTDMAFNVRNKDILAVGYGQFDYDDQRPGLVCCWSLRNITHPERIYRTPSGVTAVAWSALNDNLLAVGMFSGAIVIYNVRKTSDTPIIDTTHVSGRHYGPIRRLQWVIREAGRSANDSENLISFCMDGRVSEWSILKGFDCTGECDYHVDLMVLKRPSLRSVGTKNTKKTTEALIVRHGVGTTMSFNPSESSIYLVGTEEGQIHKCSCSYTEQYLSSYDSHTASIYSIQWSPFVPEVFLSCAADWTIKLWHLDRLQPYLTIATHASGVNDLSWSPKHAVIFACTNECYLEIWNLDASTLDPVHVETVCVDSVNSAVRFTEGSDTIVVGDSLGTVYVYAMKNFPTPLSKPSAQALQLNNALASCLSSQLAT